MGSRWTVHEGDCVALAEEGREHVFDAIVTDPPYNLTSVVKRFGKNGSAPAKYGSDGRFARLSGGFMSMRWDSTGVAFDPATWAALLRVAKPGAHLLAFGGTRTFHRMICAIEDAGWEIRDSLMYLYGTGFPKSHDVSKGIDAIYGAERVVEGYRDVGPDLTGDNYRRDKGERRIAAVTAPATDEAKQWEGWGTALKPAWESIIVARSPLSLEWEQRIMIANLSRLEAQLWSLLPASAVEECFGLSRQEHEEAHASAQWTVGEKASTQGALSDLMATSQFVVVMGTCLSIVQSWSKCLDDLLRQMSTSTTATELSLTTDLKTLNSLLSVLTPLSIIQAVTTPNGSKPVALPVAQCFHAVVQKWNAIQSLSVIGRATEEGHISQQGEDAHLRPNWEPIVLARAPLSEKTVAANVLKWGTGAINVDGCRIEVNGEKITAGHADSIRRGNFQEHEGWDRPWKQDHEEHARRREAALDRANTLGRWPANVVLDEEAAARLDLEVGNVRSSGVYSPVDHDYRANGKPRVAVDFGGQGVPGTMYNDHGGPSRFFYTAKASKSERGEGNFHPTCKPVALMRWLVRLVTPPNGVVLDPFCGSGSTGVAALQEGFRFVGIEKEPSYVPIAEKRLAAAEDKIAETTR